MRSKWVAVVLVASLALNLALAGFLLGRQGAPVIMGDSVQMFPRWVRTLPETRRAELRPQIIEHVRAQRPRVRDMRQHHQQLLDAITAEPFDIEALHLALNNMQAQHAVLQKSSHDAFAIFVSKLSPAERRMLAADMHRPRHRPSGAHPRGPEQPLEP